MVPFSSVGRSASAAALASFVLLMIARASAQLAPARIEISDPGERLDESTIELGLERDLGWIVTDSSESGPLVRMRVDENGNAEIALEGANGIVRRRHVPLPEDREEAGRTVVLIVANLAREEADELLRLLRTRKPQSAVRRQANLLGDPVLPPSDEGRSAGRWRHFSSGRRHE